MKKLLLLLGLVLMKRHCKDCQKKVNWLEYLLFYGRCVNCDNYREDIEYMRGME